MNLGANRPSNRCQIVHCDTPDLWASAWNVYRSNPVRILVKLQSFGICLQLSHLAQVPLTFPSHSAAHPAQWESVLPSLCIKSSGAPFTGMKPGILSNALHWIPCASRILLRTVLVVAFLDWYAYFMNSQSSPALRDPWCCCQLHMCWTSAFVYIYMWILNSQTEI